MTILAVTGTIREARIAAGPGVTAIAGGGNAPLLREKLERAMAGARGVISFGIAGGLAPSLSTGDCVVAPEVVHGAGRYLADAAWTARIFARLPGAMLAPLAGTDAIAASPQEKAELSRATGAHAADMESHVAAELAQAHGVPFAVLRIVLDPAGSGLPPAALHALTPEGRVNVAAVLGSLLANPAQIPSLVRTARDANKAFAALLRCRGALGNRLAGPDLG